MNFVWVLFLAFGLSMDAFAVSVTNGMCSRLNPWKNALYCGLAFGFFQGAMPLIGYYAGSTFSTLVSSVDHWIAFGLLGLIGGRMVVEAGKAIRCPVASGRAELREFHLRTLLLQAVATSIDAMAVGVSLGVVGVDLPVTIATIALVTFCCSFLGVLIGKSCGRLLQNKAELLGGIILILIGLNILLEHTGHALLG